MFTSLTELSLYRRRRHFYVPILSYTVIIYLNNKIDRLPEQPNAQQSWPPAVAESHISLCYV